MNKKLLIIPVAAVVAIGIAVTTTNTGADFSGNSNTGTISGTNATVSVSGSGGNGGSGMDIQFASPLVPGEPQSVSSTFTNTGNVNEDIYVVFDNKAALHAFDQQGRYAQVAISVNGGPSVFFSANINDGLQTGATPPGPYNCSTPTNTTTPPTPQICPLPSSQLLATNVAPTANNYWTFTYLENSSTTGPKSVGNGAQGAPFNPYPVDAGGNVTTASNLSGLPYEFYAVPTGQAGPAIPLSVS